MKITSIIFLHPVQAPGSGARRTSWQAVGGASAEAVGGTIHLKHSSLPGVVKVVPLSNVIELDTLEHLPEPSRPTQRRVEIQKAGGKKGGSKADQKRT